MGIYLVKLGAQVGVVLPLSWLNQGTWCVVGPRERAMHCIREPQSCKAEPA